MPTLRGYGSLPDLHIGIPREEIFDILVKRVNDQATNGEIDLKIDDLSPSSGLIKQIVCIYIACLIYSSAHFGPPWDKWLLPVLWMFYYGTICNFIYVLSFRIIKSPLCFFAFSWVAAIILFFLNLHGAKKISLSLREHDLSIYEHGVITPIGVAYEFFDPLGLMALIATFIFIKASFFKQGKN